MNTIPFNSMESLLTASLTEIDAAGGKVRSSFDELIGAARELASAEMAAQSVTYCAPDDDEEESQQVNDALSLREEAKFGVGEALNRALNELTLQERALDDARTTLEQIGESLHLQANALSVSMQICPKPGCACVPTSSGR